MMRLIILLSVSLFLLYPAHASKLQKRFETWLASELWPEAKKAGVTRATFQQATRDLTPDTKLPDLEGRAPKKQRQSEFRSPARYFNEKSMATLARQGAALLKEHSKVLVRIEKRTGVPAAIIVSIWGRESGFGRVKMPKNAIRSLATLAFMGRRKGRFLPEIVAALKILQEGHVGSKSIGSSWAGALGQPQFMPTKFFSYSVDEDGDGKRDIWNSVPDTLGSIGNYLAKFGWVRGRDWGFEVTIPTKVACHLSGPEQGRAIGKWSKMGVERVKNRRFPAHEERAEGYLLFPAGRLGPTFVTTPNFYVLKKYNESDVYALFVGHLADRMRGGKAFVSRWKKHDKLSRAEVTAMQKGLVAKGYDVGGADGLVGFKTRTAIGYWQEKTGQDMTCFPSRALLNSL